MDENRPVRAPRLLAASRDVARLAGTPLGRRRIRRRVARRLWPLHRALAHLHRRTLSRRTRLVAVVGSLGKTTATRATAAVLGLPPPPAGPNAYAYLAGLLLRVRPGARHAVLEVGIDGPGQMAAYGRMLRPDVVVVLSIASEHGSTFGTLERTRDEKAVMVRALGPGGVAVLNGDDPHVRWMAGQTRARIVTFGFEPGNDVRATGYELDWPDGCSVTVEVGGARRAVRTGLVGWPSAYALLAAIAVAHVEGRPLDDAASALAAVVPPPGRLEPRHLPNGAVLLLADRKSPVEAIHAALDVLAEVPARRKLVVVGEITEPPGPQGPLYRAIGERVGTIAQHAIVVGGRSAFAKIAPALRRAGLPDDAIANAGRSVARAVEALPDDLGPGDVVLVTGRDVQRLERLSLALLRRPVRCDIPTCNLRTVRCDTCPALERGWPAGVSPP
jgi:UDP-N-acetylmuramyl pentapeptide synthase